MFHYKTCEYERIVADLDLKERQYYGSGKKNGQDEEVSFLPRVKDTTKKITSNPRAPDGGWGWMVMLGNVLILVSLVNTVICQSRASYLLIFIVKIFSIA